MVRVPQIQGLGKSFIAVYFPFTIWKKRWRTISTRFWGCGDHGGAVGDSSNNPWSVFGQTDARKVRSCMTLFRQAAPDDDLFSRVLYKFYRGVEDKRTLEQLHIF
ncbi:MAG: DUF1810 family protein [Ruminococcus callidus]